MGVVCQSQWMKIADLSNRSEKIIVPIQIYFESQ